MIGRKLFAVSPLKNKSIEVEVISSHYVDHEGKKWVMNSLSSLYNVHKRLFGD